MRRVLLVACAAGLGLACSSGGAPPDGGDDSPAVVTATIPAYLRDAVRAGTQLDGRGHPYDSILGRPLATGTASAVEYAGLERLDASIASRVTLTRVERSAAAGAARGIPLSPAPLMPSSDSRTAAEASPARVASPFTVGRSPPRGSQSTRGTIHGMWPFHGTRDAARHACPLCGKPGPRRRAVRLYGHLVCRACQRDFADRRAAAWLLDRILFAAVAVAAYVALSGVDDAAARGSFAFILWPAFAIRDAVGGRSPGKRVFGLQVVSDATGEPIDGLTCFARNVLLFVPILPLVAASQMAGGKRIGDGLARTRVVRTRHARSRVFS